MEEFLEIHNIKKCILVRESNIYITHSSRSILNFIFHRNVKHCIHSNDVTYFKHHSTLNLKHNCDCWVPKTGLMHP